MSSATRHNPKFIHPANSSFHSDSDHESHSECSPRGSISLATSDDNLLPSSTVSDSEKAVSRPRRPAQRTVKFAEKTTSSPAPVYTPLNKSQKAKQVATTTLKGAGSIAGGIFGCICFIFAKACILDGGSGLSGSGSRVVVGRQGEEGNRRVVQRDMRGYVGYYDDEKRRVGEHRARVPAGVRVAHQHGHAGSRTHRTANSAIAQKSY